jgi:predicted nucleotidyltransferase
MEEHLKSRPKKSIYSLKIQSELRDKAIQRIKKSLLPDGMIDKIVMIGSCVKGSFGKYEAPGFRGSLYSDFDFIVFVSDDYKIPNWLDREISAKPFDDEKLDLAYRNKKFIDEKYDVEVFFIRRKSLGNKDYVKFGEMAGIPMSKKSKHPHIVVYEEGVD